MSQRYSQGGKVHRMLERLERSDADFHELAQEVEAWTDEKSRKKLWHTIGAAMRDRLIGGRHENYYLLPAGRHAVAILKGGGDVVIEGANCRIYAAPLSPEGPQP